MPTDLILFAACAYRIAGMPTWRAKATLNVLAER
jgi:hypothetical protein